MFHVHLSGAGYFAACHTFSNKDSPSNVGVQDLKDPWEAVAEPSEPPPFVKWFGFCPSSPNPVDEVRGAGCR